VRRLVAYLSSSTFAALTVNDYRLLIEAFAQEMRGSAGVVICRPPGAGAPTYELFDRYEARVLRKLASASPPKKF
jgi:hypothetical protein